MILTPLGVFMVALAGGLAAVVAGGLISFLLTRRILDRVIDNALVRLLKDKFEENLWELVIGIQRMTPHILMETELRAEMGGEVLERPLGGVIRISDFSGIAFNPAQLARPPLGPLEEVDTSVVLGPRPRALSAWSIRSSSAR